MPATPTLSITTFASDGFNTLTIGNLDAAGRIERANANETGGEFIIIAEGLEVGTAYFDDHNIGSGQQYIYRAIAVDGSNTAISATASATITLQDQFIHGVSKNSASSNAIPGTSLPLMVRPPHGWAFGRSMQSFGMAGAGKPTLVQSDIETAEITLDTLITQANDTNREAFRSLYNRKTVCCFRDTLGNKVFFVFTSAPESFSGLHVDIPLGIQKIDYNEDLAA
jgi:hypothetical protein